MVYKNVLLISPRFFKGKHQLSFHPLAGLGYVAESLLNAGFNVEAFDINLQYSYKDLENKLSAVCPDIIGFMVMTFGHKEVYKTISRIKKAYPKIKVVVGGPHISTLREKVLQVCAEIDYGIILEGDLSMVALCKGEDLNNIQGFMYRKGDEIITNGCDKFITDLDALSFPKYESFELDKYPTKQIGIVTSRGCPYDCIYCPVISAIGKKFRQRSAQNVVEEIEYWHNKGYKEILMLDDNFTLSRQRAEEICELLGKKDFKNISLKCPNGIRADRVDYKLLKNMRRVGFDMIAFGVEAAEDRVLKNIKKGENIATIERSIRDACNLGFDVDLFFIIGSPGERFEDVESSFSLALRYPIRGAKFYNIIPFPTTELFEWISEKGYLLHPLEHILNNASHFINEPCFFTPEMSANDRKRAFRMGQTITRRVRRNFIERKVNAPLILRKLFSFLYTIPTLENIIFNNSFFVRLKERIKSSLNL